MRKPSALLVVLPLEKARFKKKPEPRGSGSRELQNLSSCRENYRRSLRFHPLFFARSRNAQKHQDCTIQPNNILVSKAADAGADPCLRDGRDLIHHQPANSAQPVVLVGLDRQPKYRSIGWIGRECAYRNRLRLVETVVLKNHNRTRLRGVILTARDGPNLTALHSPLQSEIASINSWSCLA